MADTVAVPEPGNIVCSSCGASLGEMARFCGMCGAKLAQPGDFTADSLLNALVGGGAYRVESVLGTGSMGVVYQAEQVTLGRKVALKIIAESTDDETTRARFRREARAASQLAHPNVVQIYDFGQLEGGQPYLAMELLLGRTLEDLIDREFPLDLGRVRSIMKGVLSALQAAHDLHILHRDLKPANVFISSLTDAREVAKVLDFGVATALDSTMTSSKTWAPLTEAGFVCGTPAFMSPEQVQGFQLDQRSDLFSAAGLLYILLTKERPFAGKTPVEVGANIVLRALVPPTRARPDLMLPAPLDQFFRVAMAKKPKDRFASAVEMAQALDGCYSRFDAGAAGVSGHGRPRPDITPKAVAAVDDPEAAADTVLDMPIQPAPVSTQPAPMAHADGAALAGPSQFSPQPMASPIVHPSYNQAPVAAPPRQSMDYREPAETLETGIVPARGAGATIAMLLGGLVIAGLLVYIVLFVVE